MKTSSVDIPEVRPLRFALAGVPKHWHSGQKAVTAFFDNLSTLFPEGERFFVASVKAMRDCATAEPLRSQVEAFCAQEGHHSREHARYNQLLIDQGYPVEELEARVAELLGQAKRLLPKRRQLAITCALEHFTALMGSLVLAHPRVMEGAHPTMAALWRWHAAEENEHKAVAFDLYQAAGGTWAERCSVMAAISGSFWLRVFVQQLRLMAADQILFSPREWAELLDFLFLQPGGLPSLLGQYLSYYRPGFHPWQHDTRPLLEAWKRSLYPAAASEDALSAG